MKCRNREASIQPYICLYLEQGWWNQILISLDRSLLYNAGKHMCMCMHEHGLGPPGLSDLFRHPCRGVAYCTIACMHASFAFVCMLYLILSCTKPS